MARRDPGDDESGTDAASRRTPRPQAERAPDADQSSRRDFLKLGGLATAGLVVGGAVGAAAGATIGHQLGYREGSLDLGGVPARAEPGFDHVVVIMGENRSFDNLLGWLYTPENLPDGETFDGLAFGEYANTKFRIKVDSGHEILAHISGKMRRHFIRIIPGDRVTVEVSPYDLTRGRIIYRA